MDGFFHCLIYLALTGFGFFIIGRLLPKERFSFEEFPFCSFPGERQGRFYQKIRVHRWKDSFPDMSRIFSLFMPAKKLSKAASADQIELMIQETCIAEWIHGLLSVLGFGCIFIWKGLGGWIISILYAAGNLPYIAIQRYNRPRLVNLLQKMEKRESGAQRKEYFHKDDRGNYDEECSAIKL